MVRLGLGLAAAVWTTPAHALDNGLGKLPGLGWNSDYCTNCSGPVAFFGADGAGAPNTYWHDFTGSQYGAVGSYR